MGENTILNIQHAIPRITNEDNVIMRDFWVGFRDHELSE